MKNFKGSYTVEASFLLPMIYTVIVVILFLAFFLHDRQILNSCAYNTALRGSQMISGENIYEELERSSEKLINNRLIMTKNVATDIVIRGDEISVDYSGQLNFPVGTLLCEYFIGTDYIPVRATGRAHKQDAVDFIRKCRIVERAGTEIDKNVLEDKKN